MLLQAAATKERMANEGSETAESRKLILDKMSMHFFCFSVDRFLIMHAALTKIFGQNLFYLYYKIVKTICRKDRPVEVRLKCIFRFERKRVALVVAVLSSNRCDRAQPNSLGER